MLTKESFVYAINQIQLHSELMHKADKLFKPFGDFAPRLDAGNLHLSALLRVLREVMNDRGDVIEWWLYEDVEKTVCWDEDGEEVRVSLNRAEDLYDYLVKYN